MSGLKEKQYYVYIYRTLDGVPIYVGKGCKDRYRTHFTCKTDSRLKHKLLKLIEKEFYCLLPEIIYCKDEVEAYDLEKCLIDKYGRENNKSGTLYNIMPGGIVMNPDELLLFKERTSRSRTGPGNNFFGRKHSEELKQRMSEQRKGKPGRKMTEEHKAILRAGAGPLHHSYGLKQTEEHKKKAAQSRVGLKRSESTKAVMRNSRLKYEIHIPLVSCLTCRLSGAKNTMMRYHLDNCRHNKNESI